MGHLSGILFIFLLLSTVEIFIIIQSESTSFGDPASAVSGTITITGRWGFYTSDTTWAPIMNAKVDVYDEETTGLVDLGSTYTDSSGFFTFGPISNDDGPGEGGLDISVVVYAISSAAQVFDASPSVYNGVTSTFYNCADGTLDVATWLTPSNERGAWWILSGQIGLNKAWKYLHDTVGYTTAQVTVIWPFEDWPHYHPEGQIHLPEWAYAWPDMVIHEYAHHVMHSVYGFLPPSMTEHYINLQSNSTTAWTEGWANFFPLAVSNDPIFGWSDGTDSLYINLEAPTWYSPSWDNGDQVEGHVAGALWDIFDSASDGYDTFSNGFTHIWNVLSTQSDNTSKEFWQAWCSGGYQKQLTLMAIFQNSIDYRGLGDANGDGTVGTLDAIIISTAYYSHRGDPTWDQRADLNFDDVINILDAIILSTHYGKTYGC